MIRQTLARSAVGVAALAALAGGYAYLQKDAITPGYAAPTPVTASAPVAVATPTDFSGIVDQFGPAVVNISVTARAQHTSAQMPQGMDPDDPLFQFFKRFGPQFQGPQNAQPQLVRGLGSGFIVSPDGLILTNAHVVDNATEVTVKLTDRREFKAKVLGSDPQTDIAVIRIDAKDLPTVRLGDPSKTRVGEPVLAIGSPYGFENTVTAGIVSAKSRSLPDDTYVPFIQTDVAVNPGNSGGPLFNARGEVVGINSQIYSRSGGYQGVSFAIPIEVATRVQQQIVATGKVQHARLGVAVQEVNQAFADSFKLDRPEGALVSSVDKNGPAAKAGLEPGDVVRKIDGQPIVGSGDLPAFVGQALPGQKVTLEIWRNGEARTLSAVLGDASDKAAKVAKDKPDAGKGKLGLALRPLQPEEKQQIGVKDGLVVADAAGPAAEAGITQGDVLLSINGSPAGDIEAVRAAMAKAGKTVAVLIWRDGNRIFVPVRLG